MKRILIVDNEQLVVDYVNCLVTQLATHIDVSLHTNWTEAAYEIECNEPFDLVVTDLRMPDGREGLAIITAARTRSAQTKIILMSGDATETDLQEAAPDSFLAKPFTRAMFEMAVKKLLPDLEVHTS